MTQNTLKKCINWLWLVFAILILYPVWSQTATYNSYIRRIEKDCRNLKTGEYKSIYLSDTCNTWDTIPYYGDYYVVLKTTQK